MDVIISPAAINGTVTANPSKSAMQRAVAAALLAKGSSTIYNPGLSNDCLAAMDVAEKLGATVERRDDHVVIHSEGIRPRAQVINCGESGLGIRMFTPIASLADQALTIVGHGSLTTRPMGFFEQVLPQLGVQCSSREGKLPLQVKGPLQARDISIDGSLSSQFLTGLLMAFGAVAQKAVITVQNLKSKPYIDLTLQIMAHYGVRVSHENFERFYFDHPHPYKAVAYTVEGDWSGAAFLLVAGAIAGNVEVHHLNTQSAQSDKVILEALEKAGAKILQGMFTVIVSRRELQAFEMDATDCPDLFPPLVALAAHCKGTTKIRGVSRLAYKESDRGRTLQEEFGKLGIRIELQGDEMRVQGGTPIRSTEVYSHNDHRIAMACAIAALNGTGDVKITHAEAVNKSYPEFYDHLKRIGGIVR